MKKNPNLKPLYTALIAVAIVAIAYFFYLYAKPIIEAREYERKKLIERFDSLTKRNDSLQIIVDSLTLPLTPNLLRFKLEIVAKDFERGKEWAKLFTAIAVKETGDKINRGAVQRTNCPFGFHSRPRSEYVADYYDPKNGEIFSCYLTLEDALCDALVWTYENPPRENEPLIVWLKRRRYNDSKHEDYYANVQKIMNQL